MRLHGKGQRVMHVVEILDEAYRARTSDAGILAGAVVSHSKVRSRQESPAPPCYSYRRGLYRIDAGGAARGNVAGGRATAASTSVAQQ